MDTQRREGRPGPARAMPRVCGQCVGSLVCGGDSVDRVVAGPARLLRGQLVAHNRGPVAQGPALGAAGTHWLFRRLFQPGVGAARRGRRHEGGGGARVLRGQGASGSCCGRCCGRPWTPERAGGDHGPALAVTPLPAALPVRFCGKISVGRAARVYTGLFGASLWVVELCVRFGVSPRGSGCAFDADGRPAEDAQGTSRLRRRKDRAEPLLRRRARGTEVADGPSRSCESWRPGRGGHAGLGARSLQRDGT